MFFVANMSAIAVEKYNFNTFSNCEEVYFDADDNGAFAFAYNGKTVYTQSFVPTIKSYSFTVDGGFVGVPFIDKDTVCAVYMTNDFKYRIVRINCFDGRVSYVNSDVLDDFNYTDISICNNRLYVMKTDEVYCYVSAYDFNGKHLSDYRFSEKNVNAITTNNGSAYVFLYDGFVYRLDENKAEYCTRVRDCSDFYNSGAGFLSDSRGYIYSLEIEQVNKFLDELCKHLEYTKPQFQEIISSSKTFTEQAEILLKEGIQEQLEWFSLQ